MYSLYGCGAQLSMGARLGKSVMEVLLPTLVSTNVLQLQSGEPKSPGVKVRKGFCIHCVEVRNDWTVNGGLRSGRGWNALCHIAKRSFSRAPAKHWIVKGEL